MMQECNVGKTERILRVMMGLVLMAAGGIIHIWLGFLGLVLFFTGLMGWCPIWRLSGISTCSEKRSFLPDTSEHQGCESPLCSGVNTLRL